MNTALAFRIARSVPVFAAGALVWVAPYCYGWAGSRQIAWPDRPVTARTSWPRGVLELVNDPLRTEGWNPFFSDCANDVDYYVMKVQASGEANRLIKQLAAIEAERAQIRLNPGKEPIIEFTTVSKAARGPVVFSLGDQGIIDRWFERLPEAEPGVRKWGVHRFPKPLVARSPTLTFYVGHEAIDLKTLVIPTSVEVVADIAASDRAKRKDDPSLKAIDDFAARHRAARIAAADGPMDQIPVAQAARDAFVVFGRITDAQGKPMPDVEVWANCGAGTLFRTGHTTTDDRGQYRLVFRGGFSMPHSDTAPLGVGFQAATVSARKSGHSMQGLGRVGNLAMTDQSNTAPQWATNFAGIVRPFAPYRLDFALQTAASVNGELRDPSRKLPGTRILSLKGEQLPPSCSVLASTALVAGSLFQFTEVPVGFDWWLEIEWREGAAWKSVRTKPLSFRSPGEHRLILTLTAQGALEMTEPTQPPTPE